MSFAVSFRAAAPRAPRTTQIRPVSGCSRNTGAAAAGTEGGEWPGPVLLREPRQLRPLLLGATTFIGSSPRRASALHALCSE
eukprot:scaffold227639_cov30-Tisochrysis_lutea.AAC.2